MIEPIDFLNFSEKLLNENGREIVIRNSISRAYYYAFHHIRKSYRNQLEDLKEQFIIKENRKINDHTLIIIFLKKHRRRDLASRIYDLHTKRNQADYDLWMNCGEDNAKEFIKDVKDFINDFNHFRNSSRI